MTVYFDNAATTCVCRESAETAFKLMTEDYGNPSSPHVLGRKAKEYLDTARKNIARAMGAEPDEIFFTSGGTEADNWAIFSAAEQLFRRGKHIISTATEHDAVRKPLEKLEGKGFEVTYLRPDKTGRISASDFEAAVREDTVFATVMFVNNETGAVNPVQEMARILKSKNPDAVFHTDAVQAFCKVPFKVKTLGVDLISISSHKIHGPKGSGALYIKKGTKLPPFVMGGGQEKSYRAGTENLPNLCAFGEAARIAAENLSENIEKISALRDYTAKKIEELIEGALIISKDGAPHVLSIALPGYKSEVLMNFLDAKGICVAKSSACKKGGRSHVLESMKLPPAVIDGALRISFSRYNTIEECEYFVNELKAATEKLYKVLK